MKQFSFCFLLFAGLCCLGMSGIPPTVNPPEEKDGRLCLLPPPSSVHITIVGSGWFEFEWATVKGASHYRLKTISASTDQVLQNIVVSAKPGAINRFTVENVLTAPGPYFVRVYSICSNGVESQ